jgi:hypothetical protein
VVGIIQLKDRSLKGPSVVRCKPPEVRAEKIGCRPFPNEGHVCKILQEKNRYDVYPGHWLHPAMFLRYAMMKCPRISDWIICSEKTTEEIAR